MNSLFIIPFCAGLVVLVMGVLYNYYLCLRDIKLERRSPIRLILALSSWLKEVFLEVLLHRKIFRVNLVLGYMHASIAFGWFCLIVIGTIRLTLQEGTIFHPPWMALFAEYFFPNAPKEGIFEIFIFLLDFFLLVVLTGVALALLKRISRFIFGMKDTTRLNAVDTAALISLWLIFPIRLLCESSAAAIHGASRAAFLTGNFGDFLALFPPISAIYPYLWWGYSIVLGVFFSLLPFSRYMHILAEPLLILLRSLGAQKRIRTTPEGFTQAEISSCSKCGICLNFCQLNLVAKIPQVSPVYLISDMQSDRLSLEKVFNCGLCGRCQEFCPVGIDTKDLRISARTRVLDEAGLLEANFDYLKDTPSPRKAEVIYFIGCRVNLSPRIKEASISLLNKAGIDFVVFGEDICCGHPQKSLGLLKEAEELIEYNTRKIKEMGAKKVVFSCPHCYHCFVNEYDLGGVELLHHTQFLLGLINRGGLLPKSELKLKVVYHDPCNLGRNSNVYESPRELLRKIPNLTVLEPARTKKEALCCGGSMANLKIDHKDASAVTKDSLQVLLVGQPDAIITACQQCKRTLTGTLKDKGRIKDVSELLLSAL